MASGITIKPNNPLVGLARLRDGYGGYESVTLCELVGRVLSSLVALGCTGFILSYGIAAVIGSGAFWPIVLSFLPFVMFAAVTVGSVFALMVAAEKLSATEAYQFLKGRYCPTVTVAADDSSAWPNKARDEG